MLIIDTHVHLYPIHSISLIFDSAFKNFEAIAKKHNSTNNDQFLLTITETAKQNWFCEISTQLKSGKAVVYNNWSIQATDDTCCLKVVSSTGQIIYLIQGYQIVTIENLEVLALGLSSRIKDNQSIHNTIELVIKAESMPILPWGAGKWLGNRGKIINDILQGELASQIALGDNGGRPQFSPYPEQFVIANKLNIPIYPGSDPLPLAGEEKKVGKCGLIYQTELKELDISRQMIHLLKNRKIESNDEFIPENIFRFIMNQLLLRIKK